MKKHLLLPTTVLALAAMPAFAQSPAPPAVPSSSAGRTVSAGPASDRVAPMSKDETRVPTTLDAASHPSEQQSGQWMASSVIGASVVGPDGKTIGEINDIVLDQAGGTRAVVLGVGGFLGVGEKDVAVPFQQLQIARGADGGIDKVSISMTRADLDKAPSFMTLADKKNAGRNTPGAAASAGSSADTTGSTSPVR